MFAGATADSHAECLGDLGVSAQERLARVEALFKLFPEALPHAAAWFEQTAPHCSTHDGGQMAYFLESPDGSLFVNGSSGYWSGIVANLRPDAAILAVTGRPNIDGEPHQGSLAQFLVQQVELLRPSKVVLCHHDALLPPITPPVDTGEALARLARDASYARHVELSYANAVEILRTPRR